MHDCFPVGTELIIHFYDLHVNSCKCRLKRSDMALTFTDCRVTISVKFNHWIQRRYTEAWYIIRSKQFHGRMLMIN